MQTLVLSMISYCLNIWGTTNNGHIQIIQRLQNFAAILALGNVNKYDHIFPRLNTLSTIQMQQWYLYTNTENNIRFLSKVDFNPSNRR